MKQNQGQIQEVELEISVVAPAHNEASCIREFVTRVDAVLRGMSAAYEILVVDDGSTDRTEELLRELSETYPRLRGIFLARNYGQWAAIYAGIQHSRGEYVVVMDSDLQHLPEEIPLLVHEIKRGVDLVSGKRTNRRESFVFRRIPSLVANFLLRSTTKCSVSDMGGFKCLRGEIARMLRLRAGQHRLLPALVFLLGGTVSEVPISAPVRTTGKSHYGLARSFDVLFDILMLWFQSSFKARPLYLFGHISFWLFVFSGLINIWLLYEKLTLGVHMGTRPPFIASIIMFLAAMGFMATGFILELLSDTLNSVTGMKPYVVREVVETDELPPYQTEE
jgi:glycosyltransferase involved in cell wall biosynthesis